MFLKAVQHCHNSISRRSKFIKDLDRTQTIRCGNVTAGLAFETGTKCVAKESSEFGVATTTSPFGDIEHDRIGRPRELITQDRPLFPGQRMYGAAHSDGEFQRHPVALQVCILVHSPSPGHEVITVDHLTTSIPTYPDINVESSQLRPQYVVHHLRVRLPLHPLHHFTDEEPEDLLLAGAELLDLGWIGGQDLVNGLLDRT